MQDERLAQEQGHVSYMGPQTPSTRLREGYADRSSYSELEARTPSPEIDGDWALVAVCLAIAAILLLFAPTAQDPGEEMED